MWKKNFLIAAVLLAIFSLKTQGEAMDGLLLPPQAAEESIQAERLRLATERYNFHINFETRHPTTRQALVRKLQDSLGPQASNLNSAFVHTQMREYIITPRSKVWEEIVDAIRNGKGFSSHSDSFLRCKVLCSLEQSNFPSSLDQEFFSAYGAGDYYALQDIILVSGSHNHLSRPSSAGSSLGYESHFRPGGCSQSSFIGDLRLGSHNTTPQMRPTTSPSGAETPLTRQVISPPAPNQDGDLLGA